MTDERRFNSLHGKGAFARLRRMLQERTLSLAQIGQEFGLTRQRVSQIAQRLGIDGRQRELECTNRRPRHIPNSRKKYPFTTRQVLSELEKRGVSVAPHYTICGRRQRRAYKTLTKVLVNGVSCRIAYQNPGKNAQFAKSRVSSQTRKAKALVWGIRHGSKVRLYVIPVSRLKNIKHINIPVAGAYIRSARNPQRDWTRFENAWHLLGGGASKHSRPAKTAR